MQLVKHETDLTKIHLWGIRGAEIQYLYMRSFFPNTQLQKLHKQRITISGSKRRNIGRNKANTCRE